MEFINEEKIEKVLNNPLNADPGYQLEVLEKSRSLQGLTIEETAALLNITDPEIEQVLFESALEVKEKIYGNRIVLFAPLYLTNHCVNNCLYCAFRKDNKALKRVTLSIKDVQSETFALLKQGHKRILLVCGEHDKNSER